MEQAWGRFTARGGEAVETELTVLATEVAREVEAEVPKDRFHALVLIGGYGRGEGGVETRNGVERPHNNLDFLLITRDMSPEESAGLHARLDERLALMESTQGIGLDVSLVSASKLRHAPCLVMWYDMRFGHKTILGDREFVPSLTRFSLEGIVPGDVLWLLINRGAQMAVNALLLERSTPTEEERRNVVRWAMKAIIGYGDALLFFSGRYHWSYQEKQRRMASFAEAPELFRAAYDEAIEFRFQPCYDTYLSRDLAAWMHDLLHSFERIHMECESQRLNEQGWSWSDYPGLTLRHEAFEEGWSTVRGAAKKLVGLMRNAAPPAGTPFADGLAYRLTGPRGWLPACYPVVLYGLEDASLRKWTQEALGAANDSPTALRLAFMRAWGRHSDPNFFKVARRLGLPIEP